MPILPSHGSKPPMTGHRVDLLAAIVMTACALRVHGREPLRASTPQQASPTPTALPTLPFPFPDFSPTPPDDTDPEARSILARSDAAMNTLTSVRRRSDSVERLNPTRRVGGTYEEEWVAPDRYHGISIDWQGRVESIRIGADHWSRTDDGLWTHERRQGTWTWPRFDRLRRDIPPWFFAARNIHVAREDDLPSGRAWVLTYVHPESTEEGGYLAFWTDWIDQSTLRVMRQEAWNNDPWGNGGRFLTRIEYFDFDAPITIEPPEMPAPAPPTLRIFAPFLGHASGGIEAP